MSTNGRSFSPKAVGVLERIRVALGAVIRAFRTDLNEPSILRTPPAPSLTPIVTADEGEWRYILCRRPIAVTRVLSEREVEVAILVGDGLTNEEIADRLHLSPSAVTAHLERIFSKVCIHRRVALARLAVVLESVPIASKGSD